MSPVPPSPSDDMKSLTGFLFCNPIRACLENATEELFGLSDELLFQIAKDESFIQTLPLAIQKEATSRRYAEKIHQMRNPHAGEIHKITGVDINVPESPAIYSRPLLVLLDEPYVDPENCESVPGFWWGWVASTLVEFAAWWDVALQGEERPVSCAMVQAWNRVLVAEKHFGGCVYVPPVLEYHTIRAVWDEYASGDEPDKNIQTAFGYLNCRVTLRDLDVVTGAPMESDGDPRTIFQELYLRASEVVTERTRRFLISR